MMNLLVGQGWSHRWLALMQALYSREHEGMAEWMNARTECVGDSDRQGGLDLSWPLQPMMV
jgi:hypothetical protein